MKSVFYFFTTRRFWPLFVTQLFGAFNDNLYKNAMVMLITYRLAEQAGLNGHVLVTLSTGIFILPYFLFSALAGQIADHYPRDFIARTSKIIEIVLMAIACIGFLLGNTWILMAILFCMGAQSTFFSPVKYALLPQHLKEHELLGGNAIIGAGTFLTILLGTIAGGLLVLYPLGEWLICGAVMACAVIGYLASRVIPDAPAPAPDLRINRNFMKETCRLIAFVTRDRVLFATVMSISWFWFVGATFLSQLPPYAKEVLHADETVVTTFLVLFSVGIGIGSLLSHAVLRGKVSTRYVPAAALGMAVFSADLYIASATPFISAAHDLMHISEFMRHGANMRILADMLLISIFGGLYIVPLNAFLQARSAPEQVARMVAANNILNALFMVASAVIVLGMIGLGFKIPHVFLMLAIVNGIFAFYVHRKKLHSSRQGA